MSPRLRLIVTVVGALLFGALVIRLGTGLIIRMLWQVGWSFLLVIALRLAWVVARAAALWLAMPPRSLSLWDVCWIRLSTEAVEVLTLTGPFVAEPTKGWLFKQRGLETADAFGVVIIEYLLYTMEAGWIAAAAIWLLLSRGTLSALVGRSLTAVLIVIGAMTLGVVYAAATGIGLIAPTVRWMLRRAGRGRGSGVLARIEALEHVLVAFLSTRRLGVLQVLAVQGAAHLSLALEVWIVFSALNLDVPWTVPLLFEGAVKFVDVAFFYIPGRLGAEEGFYALVAGSLGLPPAAGLALAVVRRIRGLAVGAAGLAAPSVLKGSSR